MDKKQLVEDIMKSLEDKQYSKEELGEIVKKAVTSMAATAENGPVSEEALSGESAPSIQDATTPTQEVAPETIVEAADKTIEDISNVIPDPVQVEGDAQGGKLETIFAPGLFTQEYSTGATLKQGPSGNIMTNMKPANANYVEQYKNSTKNQKLTHVDFGKDSKKN